MDIYYLVFILPAMIIALWAQIKVKSTFSRYSEVYSAGGVTAYDAARRILDANGLKESDSLSIGQTLKIPSL